MTAELDPEAGPRGVTTITVHEEDVLTLVACAVAGRSFPDLDLADPSAEQLLTDLALDPARFDARRLRASAVRTTVIDGLVREFFARNPTGVAVALLSGLCTRFSRVDNGVLRWVDLEPGDVAAFKAKVLRDPDRRVVTPCCSIACSAWMRRLADDAAPVLLVAQGGFRRAPIGVRDAFFTNAATYLPTGTELVIEHDAAAPLRASIPRDGRASISVPDPSGAWAIYPRLRMVPLSEHDPALEQQLVGMNGVSRLFHGHGIPSVAHLRFS